jgi:Tfp pilus assembly protein PilF
MGFFDWLFGKQRKTEPKPPRPKVIAGRDDNSPQLLIDNGNGVVTIMDREMFDYMYGESSAPDPAQRDLDELLPKVTRVRAVASGMIRGRALGSEVVLETTDPSALAALRETLRVVEDPSTFTHCGCLGGPTLELFSGQDLIATIGLQHGHSIRWAKWKHDARLRNGQALSDWLTRHGIDPGFLDVLLHNQYDVGGMMPLGLQRSGPSPLSRAEQQVRLAELSRVRGGDLRRALAQCQKVIDEGPGQAFAYAVRGLICQQQGDQAGCIADCSDAIRLGLREAEVFFARAVAQDHLGQSEEALADCTAALEIDPKHVNAYNSRGLIRCRLAMLDEAMTDLNEAIRLAPEWGLPYLNRVQIQIQRDDLDAAIADCDRVIAQIGQSQAPADRALAGMAFWNRAQCYRMRGDQARAESDIREAVRRNPNLAHAQAGPA